MPAPVAQRGRSAVGAGTSEHEHCCAIDFLHRSGSGNRPAEGLNIAAAVLEDTVVVEGERAGPVAICATKGVDLASRAHFQGAVVDG